MATMLHMSMALLEAGAKFVLSTSKLNTSPVAFERSISSAVDGGYSSLPVGNPSRQVYTV